MTARIPVAGPWITDREIDYVAQAAKDGWYDRAQDFPRRFEAAFATWVGARHAIALPSCTSALHLALVALGIGPGDEVIVPELTWIATAAPIKYVGATPVFADVDTTTWCLSAESVASLVSPRTRAIIAVDLYGNMPDYHALRAVADRNGLALIEDAAEAIGSTFREHKAGALGDIGAFSFHGSKTMTTGEGGMLVTDRDDVIARAQSLRDHGRKPGDVAFFNAEVGFKYRMSTVQAALGLAQLERIDALVAKKRWIFETYKRRLGDDRRLTFNAEPAGTSNSFWMTTVVIDPALGIAKEALAARLAMSGVDTRPFFHPLSSLPAFERELDAPRARRDNRVAQQISPFGINLPSALTLDEVAIDRVACALEAALDAATPPATRATGKPRLGATLE
jgi:perosamine synthetase